MESWLQDYLRYDNTVRGKHIAISVDSGLISENPLYKAYYSKSFTDNDIKLHFLIIDILFGGESLTLKEIVSRLDKAFGEIFEEQTVRNKLKEYVEEGILISEKKGKTAYFRLSDDRIKAFLDEYDGLSDAVKFFSATQEFGIIGDSIMKAESIENDLFLMKHNYIVHTLEDIVLCDIMNAIDEKRSLKAQIYSLKSGTATECNIIPMQILSSVQTGRRYLLGYAADYERFNAFRLDTIKKVAMGDVFSEFDKLYAAYQRNKGKSFGVSFNGHAGNRNVEPLEIVFHVDEEAEDFIIARLEREKRCGTLVRTAENTYTLTLDLYDPNEAMQWVKSFIGRIKEIRGGTEALRETFESDIKRMSEMYGGESIEHIQ